MPRLLSVHHSIENERIDAASATRCPPARSRIATTMLKATASNRASCIGVELLSEEVPTEDCGVGRCAITCRFTASSGKRLRRKGRGPGTKRTIHNPCRAFGHLCQEMVRSPHRLSVFPFQGLKGNDLRFLVGTRIIALVA